MYGGMGMYGGYGGWGWGYKVRKDIAKAENRTLEVFKPLAQDIVSSQVEALNNTDIDVDHAAVIKKTTAQLDAVWKGLMVDLQDEVEGIVLEHSAALDLAKRDDAPAAEEALLNGKTLKDDKRLFNKIHKDAVKATEEVKGLEETTKSRKAIIEKYKKAMSEMSAKYGEKVKDFLSKKNLEVQMNRFAKFFGTKAGKAVIVLTIAPLIAFFVYETVNFFRHRHDNDAPSAN